MFTAGQNILGVVVLFLTVCVLVTVLGLVLSMPNLPKSVITDEICLPDHKGILDCGKTEKRLYEYTNARIDAELKILGEKHEAYVKDRNEGKDLVKLKSFVEERYFDRKPAARIVMRQPDSPRSGAEVSSNNVNIVTIRNWEMDNEARDDGGFLRFGMRYSDGRLMVPLTGTYSVSSYMYMSAKPGKNSQRLGHALYKYHIMENKEEELVSSSHPIPNRTRKYTNGQSSFLTTVVNLISGEELLVKVSNNADFPEYQQNYLAVYVI